jgi:PAT family beta-lactamase induction signal transducer AmpG
VTAHETASRTAATDAASPKTLLQTVATYFEPRLVAVLFMGFSSGLPLALTGATLQIWQTESGVSLGAIGFFVLVGVVYSLKFVWAPFMDRTILPGPLGGLGRRRGWAVLTQCALMAAIVMLGFSDPAAAPAWTAFCAVLVAFASASQDIVIDAYRIELLDEHQQGAGAAMTQYGYRVGMLASGAGALYLAERVSWSAVYLVMAALVLVGLVTVLLTREPATPSFVGSLGERKSTRAGAAALGALVLAAIGAFLLVKFVVLSGVEEPAWLPNVIATLVAAAVPVGFILLLPASANGGGLGRSYVETRRWLGSAVIQPFAEFGTRQGWLLILLLIVLFKLGDAVAGVMANPFYVKIGFSKDEIASVSKVFGLAATLLGVFLGGLVVARIGIARGLLIGGVLQMLSNLMFSAQAVVGHDIYFLMLTIGLENLSGGVGSAAFVAYLSGLCNVAFTGTQYALFSSLAAIGRTVLSSPGGVLAEHLGWVNYFLLSTVMAVPGLLLLLWMMRRYPVPANEPAVETR